MATYLLSIGINHYTDHAFKTLSCCENDATNINEVFKRDLRLGERARKLVGAVSLAQVKAELREIGREIRNGDTFVFFFSGHGYQHPKREDQYLLFPEAEAVLVNKGHRDGMLSLSMLCDLTDHWAGVARVFVFDACRSWLPATKGATAVEVFNNEDALAYIASRDPRRSAPLSAESDAPPVPESLALPPLILNATKNGEVAQELETKGRGVLALAWERTLERQSRNGEVIWLGPHSLEKITEEMQALLRDASAQIKQTPFMTPPGGKVLLFKPAVEKHVTKLEVSTPNDDDATEWLLAQARDSIEAYEAYVRRHPRGQHDNDAFARIAELSQQARDTAAREANARQVVSERAVEARRQQEAEEHAGKAGGGAVEHRAGGTGVQQPTGKIPLGSRGTKGFVLMGIGALMALAVTFGKDLTKKGVAAPPATAPALMPIPGAMFEDAFMDGSGKGPVLVVLPGGSYARGSTEHSSEQPVLPVTVKSYSLGQTEVTVRQYLACVNAGGCSEPEWRKKGSQNHYQSGSSNIYKKYGVGLTGETYPIIGVSWDNAQQYVKWLEKKTGLPYRLPTEAEWEYACRGAKTGERYCGGNEVEQVGWSNGNSGGTPHEVKGKAQNGYGLYDMSGNVWEWVEDSWHDNYQGSPVDGSAWTSAWTENRPVLRGGSFAGDPPILRSAYRGRGAPDGRYSDVGFRIARTLP